MLAQPGVGHTELVDHVGADAVGAERDGVLGGEAVGIGVADRVVHVGARVVHEGALESVVSGQVHTVDEQPALIAEAGQPIGGVGVGGAFRHVNVHTHVVPAGQVGRRGQRVIGAGEGRVDADVATAACGEVALVLCEAALGPVGAVTVGDAVAAAHPHADLGARPGNHVERALDGVGRLVMIHDGRAA